MDAHDADCVFVIDFFEEFTFTGAASSRNQAPSWADLTGKCFTFDDWIRGHKDMSFMAYIFFGSYPFGTICFMSRAPSWAGSLGRRGLHVEDKARTFTS